MVLAVINEGRKENGKAEDEEKHQKTGEEREKQKSQRQRWQKRVGCQVYQIINT